METLILNLIMSDGLPMVARIIRLGGQPYALHAIERFITVKTATRKTVNS